MKSDTAFLVRVPKDSFDKQQRAGHGSKSFSKPCEGAQLKSLTGMCENKMRVVEGWNSPQSPLRSAAGLGKS